MATNVSQSEEECTCPVCCDIFQDPVVLLCGHSFCKTCLQEWWRRTAQRTCPVCKEIFLKSQPPPPRNLALRNLSDSLRQERSQRANSGSNEICSLHSERLKLYCENDKELICLICKESRKHKQHNCVPVDEAARAHRMKLKVKLMPLKSKLWSFKAEKLKCDKMADHIKLQAQQTEKTIREKFQKLYQFLRAEEAARIDALRKEATHKSQRMNIRIVNLASEISSLTDKIQTIEREMKSGDLPFMMNIKSTMKRSKCNLPELETPSGSLIDEAEHLGNLLFEVWDEMRTIVRYSPVILDPNTCGMLLTISKQMTRSTEGDKYRPLPRNPERLGNSEVLGSEGFSSGKHSWDVKVGGVWTAGVALKKKNPLKKEKIWGIYVYDRTHLLYELTPTNYGPLVSEGSVPQRIRVQLDYDKGVLSFFDLDRNMRVHTMKVTFRKTVFPYFRGDAKILPASFTVQMTKPT